MKITLNSSAMVISEYSSTFIKWERFILMFVKRNPVKYVDVNAEKRTHCSH